eukprot:13617327-Alexandrium_andersonii.AAC.1
MPRRAEEGRAGRENSSWKLCFAATLPLLPLPPRSRDLLESGKAEQAGSLAITAVRLIITSKTALDPRLRRENVGSVERRGIWLPIVAPGRERAK